MESKWDDVFFKQLSEKHIISYVVYHKVHPSWLQKLLLNS